MQRHDPVGGLRLRKVVPRLDVHLQIDRRRLQRLLDGRHSRTRHPFDTEQIAVVAQHGREPAAVPNVAAEIDTVIGRFDVVPRSIGIGLVTAAEDQTGRIRRELGRLGQVNPAEKRRRAAAELRNRIEQSTHVALRIVTAARQQPVRSVLRHPERGGRRLGQRGVLIRDEGIRPGHRPAAALAAEQPDAVQPEFGDPRRRVRHTVLVHPHADIGPGDGTDHPHVLRKGHIRFDDHRFEPGPHGNRGTEGGVPRPVHVEKETGFGQLGIGPSDPFRPQFGHRRGVLRIDQHDHAVFLPIDAAPQAERHERSIVNGAGGHVGQTVPFVENQHAQGADVDRGLRIRRHGARRRSVAGCQPHVQINRFRAGAAACSRRQLLPRAGRSVKSQKSGRDKRAQTDPSHCHPYHRFTVLSLNRS